MRDVLLKIATDIPGILLQWVFTMDKFSAIFLIIFTIFLSGYGIVINSGFSLIDSQPDINFVSDINRGTRLRALFPDNCFQRIRRSFDGIIWYNCTNVKVRIGSNLLGLW